MKEKEDKNFALNKSELGQPDGGQPSGTDTPIIRTAAQTAVLMSILTLGSKLLGFLREMIMASYFGTSYVVDAYVMAQAIPNMLFAGILGSMYVAYMPLFSEKMEKEGLSAGNRFTSQVMVILMIASAISALVGLIFARPLVWAFAHGFTGKTAELTVFFVRVTFAYSIFLSAVSILETYLQYRRVFLPQIVVSYFQNIVVIATIILSAFMEVRFLAFGLLVAYAVRLLWVWILAKRKGFKFSFKHLNSSDSLGEYEDIKECKDKNIRDKSLRAVAGRILPLAIPVFIGSSISQIGLFVDRFLASGLSEGSVAALNYANTLNNMVSVLSISVLTIMIYPRLTQAVASGDMENFARLLQKGMNIIFMIALPFSLGAMVYAHEIVQIVFERGAFDPTATAFTGDPYICYSVGMLFGAMAGLMVQGYYAMQDTKSPMIYGIVCVIIDIILNFVLVKYMAHSGLALSTSIGSMAYAFLLYLGFRRKYPDVKPVQSWTKMFKISVAVVIAIGASFIVYQFIILPLAHIIYMRMVQVGLAVVVAALIYLPLLKLFKVEELDVVKEVFKR